METEHLLINSDAMYSEEMLISKLFLDQARIDSIIVTDDAVEGELNMRMNDAIRRAGSEEALVEFFQKEYG